MPKVSKTELLNELQRLAEDLGHPPTLQQLRDRGEYAAMTYYNRFGSWQEALQAAGYEPRPPESEIPHKALLKELQRVADELGAPPSAEQMNEHGKYWVSTYRRQFGSWRDAVVAAGFDPPAESGPIPTEELLAEIRRLASQKGGRPTYQEMNEEGAYGASTYERRFGSWSEAVDTALADEDYS